MCWGVRLNHAVKSSKPVGTGMGLAKQIPMTVANMWFVPR